MFGLDRGEHDLSTFPHMSVQLFEHYSQDLVDRGWTTMFWDRKWQQHEREVATRLQQTHSSGAQDEPVAMAGQPEMRPPWLVRLYRDIRFVKNTGSVQVFQPEHMVLWGPQAQILAGARGNNLRLTTHAFKLTFLDLTGRKLEDGEPAAAPAAADVTAGQRRRKASASTGGTAASASPQARPVMLPNRKSSKRAGQKRGRRSRSNETTPDSSLAPSDNSDSEDEGVVQRIVRMEMHEGQPFFLVQWEGYVLDESEDSNDWKSRKHLQVSCRELLEEFEEDHAPLSRFQPSAARPNEASASASQPQTRRSARSALPSATPTTQQPFAKKLRPSHV